MPRPSTNGAAGGRHRGLNGQFISGSGPANPNRLTLPSRTSAFTALIRRYYLRYSKA